MNHQITKETTGSGNMAKITPKCSCGWSGHGIEAYNDDKMFQVNRQADYHLLQVRQAEVDTAQAV